MKAVFKKGRHNETFPWSIINTWPYFHNQEHKISFDIMFHQSCLIDTNDDDTHKLFGLSFCNKPFKKDGKWYPGHHYNSVRIGWQSFKGEIALVLYMYRNGQRTMTVLKFVQPGQQNQVQLIFSYKLQKVSAMVFENGKATHEIQQEFEITNKISYRLGLYHGGDNPAPHDLHYFINKRK